MIYLDREELTVDIFIWRLRIRWLDAEDGRTWKLWMAFVRHPRYRREDPGEYGDYRDSHYK